MNSREQAIKHIEKAVQLTEERYWRKFREASLTVDDTMTLYLKQQALRDLARELKNNIDSENNYD